MDEKSLEILEFPVIREILSGFTSFSASRQLALELTPLTDYETISRLLEQSAEARHLLVLEPGLSIGSTSDVREEVGMAALGRILDTGNLVEIQRTLAALRRLRDSLEKLSEQFPLLWGVAEGITRLPGIEKNITGCLSENGEVLDTASPQLASVRHQLGKIHQQMWDTLESLMKTTHGQQVIQEPIITEREGRYVIPVKIEFRRELGGIVHDVSNTGATVFVEPWATVEMGNTLRELKAEEKREIERILGKLSSEAGAYAEEISRNVELAAELDLAMAKAKFAAKYRAVEPTLTDFDETGHPPGEGQPGIIRLLEARHPILAEKAVPISIEIGGDFSILVITGPNTGGKTVALKTVGLFSLMTQAGLPIPASPESRLPVFDGIYADIGDEQSIEQTLSSFSWHMGNIVRIVNGATRKSLVLLDELGTNTDPAEGAALAHSILLRFLRQGTLTVITTHYSSLKVFAHATPGLQNASFEFDPVTFAPTYRLTVGAPGGSNALATASRLGLLPDVVNEAKGMLSESALELDALLQDLMTEKQKTETIRQNLETVAADMETRQLDIASRQRKLKKMEKDIIVQFRDRIVLETNNLHREIKRAAADLRKEKSSERIKQARQTLSKVQEQLQSEAWSSGIEKTGRKEADKTAIMAGDTVRLSEADVPATVLSVSEKNRQVVVQVGQARLNIGLHRVEKIASAADRKTGNITQAKLPPARHVSPELDLRGKRADEAEIMLDSYLNDATLAGQSEVRIIHGIGTGALRRMVRDILTSHPLVKSFRAGGRGEGDDGASVVSL